MATDTTKEQFPILVREAYDQSVEQFGTDRVTLWRGEMFSVVHLARTFLARIQHQERGGLFVYHHKFEANTGIDCSDFFIDMKRQYLSMRATLEDFLESDPDARFRTQHPLFLRPPHPGLSRACLVRSQLS